MKKVFSLLLSMTIVCALILSAAPAQAATSSGMEFSKTATVNKDGTIDITLEAFATGDKVITTVTRDVPTDIILVLDQSLSMTSNHLQSEPYAARVGATNETLYNVRHNGGSSNLWYKIDDQTYVSVSVAKVEDKTSLIPQQLSTNYVNYSSSYGGMWGEGELNTNCYWYYADNLYEQVGDEYLPVTLKRDEQPNYGSWYTDYIYTYTFSDKKVVTSTGNNTNPYSANESRTEFQKHAPLYTLIPDSTKTVYTYTYTLDGVTYPIGTSTGADTVFEPTLYERSTGQGTTCLAALKTAVAAFANGVAAKAAGPDGNLATTDDNVNHRIAVVGFGADQNGTYQQNSAYRGTELFVGATQYGYRNAADHYDEAFQNMNTQAGQDNVSASINQLVAEGYTYVNLGLEMANGILNANPLNTNEERNRVIIVFTDGVPGGNTEWEEPGSRDTAEAAWELAGTAKAAGVTVYAIGVFDEADPSSAGSWATSATQKDKANYYMQHMSSNNGSVSNPSYYLSAASSGSLTNIFKQLSDNIQSGSTTSTLTKEAVVKDLVAPQFTLPANATAADITIETYACTGKENGKYTWTKNVDSAGNPDKKGAKATVNGDQVSVTGFDFVGNYVTEIKTNNEVTGYQGHKLVIKFKVVPEADFLGGNDVYTNASAGIYENDKAKDPAVVFPRPQVNVPIDDVDVTVTAADLNVYLLEGVTLKQIKDSTTVMCGDVELILDDENYGLDPAMLEYVKITATYTDDANGKALTDLEDLKEDTTYTVAVTVEPKEPNPVSKEGKVAVMKDDDDTGDINVFKPVLTFADSPVNYLAKLTNADNYYDQTNYKSIKWKHERTGATADKVTMLTKTAPTVDLAYTPEVNNWIDSNNKVITTVDIPVNVNASIGGVPVNDYTKTIRLSCNDCGFVETDATNIVERNPEFIVHIKNVYGELKIVKNGLVNGESAVFTVTGIVADGTATGTSKTWTVVLTADDNAEASATITGLLVDSEYSVVEDANWTWTYDEKSSIATSTTILAKDAVGAPAMITFENEENDKWMNDESAVVNAYQGN